MLHIYLNLNIPSMAHVYYKMRHRNINNITLCMQKDILYLHSKINSRIIKIDK